MPRLLPLASSLLLAFACGCDPASSSSDDPDARAGTPDAAPSDAAADAGSGLRGRTRIAFIRDGVPYVTDGDASQLLPAWDGEPLGSLYRLDLSDDAQSLAFCASDDNRAIYPFGGPIAELRKLADGPMCKNAQISADGQTVSWIRYGEGVQPAKQLRFHRLDGQPALGDNQLGFRQMWNAQFLDGDRELVVLLTASSLRGSIHHFDRETGEETLLLDGDGDVGADFRVGPDDQIAATHVGDLVIIDARTGETETVLDLADHPEIEDAGIRFVESPSFSPDGDRVVFWGRTGPGGTRTEVLVYDLATEQVTRITDDERPDSIPRFGAEGEWVYWVRESVNLVRARADGTGSIEPLVEGDVYSRIDVTWLPGD